MYTIRFEVERARPDTARFVTREQTEEVVAHMIHVRYAHHPLRIRVTNSGRDVYFFERK